MENWKEPPTELEVYRDLEIQKTTENKPNIVPRAHVYSA